jgi:hypothetical protein
MTDGVHVSTVSHAGIWLLVEIPQFRPQTEILSPCPINEFTGRKIPDHLNLGQIVSCESWF